MAEIAIAVPPTPCSMSEFARWLGVDEKSVRSAVKVGRLSGDVIGRDRAGHPTILDCEAAATQWAEQTRPRAGGNIAPGRLAEATLRERNARADRAELETAIKRGEYVLLAEVDRRWSGFAVQIRTGLLGLPTRARQRLPHLTAADVTELDRLVREVLEEFAEQRGAS